jgi:hypothetical protein
MRIFSSEMKSVSNSKKSYGCNGIVLSAPKYMEIEEHKNVETRLQDLNQQ